MRFVALILGILGGLAAGALGLIWIRDYNSMRGLIESTTTLGQTVGADMTQQLADLQRLVTAAYILLGSLVLGIVGGILAMRGKGRLAALLMLIGAVAPAIFAPQALVFTCLLLIGALVSFFVKPKAMAAPVALPAGIGNLS